MFHHRVGVEHGNLFKPWVFALLAGPVQQGKVYHAVDNCPSPGIVRQIIPGADEFSHRVEPPCQQIGGVHPDFPGIFIAGQAVVRHRGGHEHKPNVMMQPIVILKAFFHFLFRLPRNVQILFLSGILVHQPHHAAPETVSPPVQSVVNIPAFGAVGAVVIISRFISGVWDFILVFSLTRAILQRIFSITCPAQASYVLILISPLLLSMI